jgi:carboxylesterase
VLRKRSRTPDATDPLLVDPDVDDPIECLELLEEHSYVFCDARDVGDYWLRSLHTMPFRGWLQTSDEAPPYYRPERQPFARSGLDPTLVMTHGYTGNPGNWTYLAEAFDEFDNGYYVPLLPGHGLDHTEFGAFDDRDWSHGLNRSLTWLKEFSHDLVGIGLSMGGALNLLNWRKYEALVLINVPFFVPDWRRFLLPVMQWLRTYHRFDESNKTVPVKSLLCLRDVLSETREILGEVDVPVLVINHRGDETVSVNHGLRYKNAIPKAEHRILEEGHHESPTDPEVAQQLATEIQEWLSTKGVPVSSE